LSDGLGGTVDVSVGGTACTVESISETEILCRTVPGVEEAAPFGADRTFVSTPGMSSGLNHRKFFDLTWVPTKQMCEDMCRYDASCWAFIFNSQDPNYTGCWLIDYFGLD